MTRAPVGDNQLKCLKSLTDRLSKFPVKPGATALSAEHKVRFHASSAHFVTICDYLSQFVTICHNL